MAHSHRPRRHAPLGGVRRVNAYYEHGRRARRDGCYRVLCCPDSDAQLAEWLRGWDDADRELAGEPPETHRLK